MIPEQAVVPFGPTGKGLCRPGGQSATEAGPYRHAPNGRVEILSGLQPGEQIVTDNNRLLVNGQPLVIDK